MLDELEYTRLEVVLIPSKVDKCRERGGMIRCVQMQNPAWYRKFCEQFPSYRGRYQKRCEWCEGIHDGRKNNRCLRRKRVKVYTRMKWLFDTAIKRRDTVRGLNELLSGRCESLYAQRLKDFIRQHWVELERAA